MELYPLTDKVLYRAAKALAEAANGGMFEVDYTEDQRELWLERVRAAMLVGGDGSVAEDPREREGVRLAYMVRPQPNTENLYRVW